MSIKELMGHSSILTTQTYLSLESEELKNAQ
jgi:site-specific recombinase XerD